MKTNIKLNNRAFTIVETLIVLAIAAVIIIIVLLAVPALQRTTRNTDIKNDASSIAAAINDFESNNAGALPSYISVNTAKSNKVVDIGSTTAGTNNSGSIYFCAATASVTSNQTCSNPIPAYGAKATVQAADSLYVPTPLGAAGTSPTFIPANAASATNLNAGVIIIYLDGSCPSIGTPIVSASNNVPYATTSAAIFYPDETGGSVGNVLCVQA